MQRPQASTSSGPAKAIPRLSPRAAKRSLPLKPAYESHRPPKPPPATKARSHRLEQPRHRRLHHAEPLAKLPHHHRRSQNRPRLVRSDAPHHSNGQPTGQHQVSLARSRTDALPQSPNAPKLQP
ncbi:hypothetical protein D1007_20150 [Hordeum vulgare]|nr:hypothetical protein D1007_20150 [Hordeum vulgare]